MARLRLVNAKDEERRRALAPILGAAFGFPSADALVWLSKAGDDGVRALVDGEETVGGLIVIPMGQFFGGKSVPTAGVAGVAVPPAARGRGAATTMMALLLRELRRGGTPLSTLYPATVSLYDRAGYGIAGGLHRTEIAARDITGGEMLLTVREADTKDERSIRSVYRAYAHGRDGWLDRGPYVWRRTRAKHDGSLARGFVAERGGRVEGYVFYHQERTTDGEYHLQISDMAYASPQAARTLLAFLRQHKTLADKVRWACAPDDGMLSLLGDRRHRLDLHFPWMLRIVDVAGALTARGYPRAASGRLTFDIRDEVVRANGGKYILDVEGGSGHARPGGRGALRMNVRALASLYSGHHRASRLAEMGLLEGSRRAVDLADVVFSGSAPSLGDFF